VHLFLHLKAFICLNMGGGNCLITSGNWALLFLLVIQLVWGELVYYRQYNSTDRGCSWCENAILMHGVILYFTVPFCFNIRSELPNNPG